MIGMSRQELETMAEDELHHECRFIEDVPYKDQMCRAIACTVAIVMGKNNLKVEKDIKSLLGKD